VRILVVSQYFWPENFRINDLVAELVARGHEVVVLTGLPNYPQGSVFADFRRDRRAFGQFKGASVVRVPLIPRGTGRLTLALNYLSFAVCACLLGPWRLRGRRFDAVFAYQVSPVTVGIPAVLLRALKRAPLVFWVLDLWPETLQALGVVRSGIVLRAIGRLVSFIYNRCDLILAQSRSLIPLIAKNCAAASRIEYFPSWAEAIFRTEGVVPAVEVPPQPDSFDVMFAGNLGEAQDVPAILAAAELLRANGRIRWLLVGDGRMAGWTRTEIVRRGLQHCVLMLGKFPVERMPSFYRRASALLVSLRDEPIFAMTIPGKLQSYLAAGVPVLAMLNGEGADVVRRSGAGLTCSAGDSAGLAAAVLELAALSADRIAAMCRNGLTVSETEFNRDALMVCLEDWLAGLTAGAQVHS
jgi:colanic acid biosynthesis glycosyl transferase WcaI